MHIPSGIAARLLLCCAVAAAPAFAFAQDSAKPAKPAVGTTMSPSETYGKLLGLMEQEFVSAAEAMPEDKFDFAPPAAAGEFKGVRSFGAQTTISSAATCRRPS
jgi:hypothetical protein